MTIHERQADALYRELTAALASAYHAPVHAAAVCHTIALLLLASGEAPARPVWTALYLSE